VRIRLYGIDTAEIHSVSHDSAEYKRGIEHKKFVSDWLFDNAVDYRGTFPFRIATKSTGKYGRYLANLQSKQSGDILSESLIAEFGDDICYN